MLLATRMNELSPGERLLIAVKRSGLLHRDVAKGARMHHTRLSQLINHERLMFAPRPLSRGERRRLARVLKIKAESLFGEEKVA